MSAMWELREGLRKRGESWHKWPDEDSTTWQAYSDPHTATESMDGTLIVTGLTPAQAIAATLRNEDTYTREDVEGAFVSGYSLGLDMFDSSKPDSEKGWNQNERNLDEEMEDLGWVRKDAVTLGPTDPRERGLIPHFWTGDWTLHIEAASLPERIDVTLPDQRGREVYSARVHHFVPERTCHIEQTGHVKVAGVDYYDDDYECSECGAEMFEGYNFCPNCGRKVVDE